jgi:hypothetical protein
LTPKESELGGAAAVRAFTTGDWGRQFSAEMLDSCSLTSKFEKIKTIISAFQSEKDAVYALSLQIPWYPEGFEETGFPGFAYQNISNQGCTYSFGRCAKFKIVSQTDCPSNLYVRTNSLSNGVVVDWSNDTAVVRAGQIAIMETSFTSDEGRQWEFVEINCY